MKKYFFVFVFSLLCGNVFFFFSDFFLHGKSLLTNDFNYSIASQWFWQWLKLNGSWNDLNMLGFEEQIVLNPTSLIQLFFIPLLSVNMVFILFIFFCFFSSHYLFKAMRLSNIPAIFTALLFTLSPLFFTFIATGHLGKLYLTPFMALVIAQLLKIIFPIAEEKKHFVTHCLLLAIFLSFSFLTTAYQTALYFYLILPFLVIWALLVKDHEKTKKECPKIGKKLIGIMLAVFLSIILSSHAIFQAIKLTDVHQVEIEILGVSPQKKMEKNKRWDWATQWSFSPKEMIDFFIVGVMGHSSFSKKNPYWGEIGRTPGYTGEKWLRQDIPFANYSGTNHYLGILSIFFFFFAIFFYKKTRQKNKLFFFWMIVCLTTLLLSFGRHFPLYHFFYSIPLMDTMRNPNKFLQVFHIAFFIVVAMGVNHFYSKLKKINQIKEENTEKFHLLLRPLWWNIGSFCLLSLAFCGIFYLYLKKNEITLILQSVKLFDSQTAIVAIENAFLALKNGALWIVCVSFLLVILLLKGPKNIIISMVILTFVATIDTARINKFYFYFENPSLVEKKSPVINLIKQKQKDFTSRGYILKDNAITKVLLWKMAPYSYLPFLNHRVTRTLPLAFSQFMSYALKNNFTGLQMANVELIFNTQIQKNPALKLTSSIEKNTDILYIYRLKKTLPRVYAVEKAIFLQSRKDVLKNISTAGFDPSHKALFYDPKGLAKKSWAELIEKNQLIFQKTKTKIVDFSAEKMTILLEKNRQKDSLLILANHYHPHWQAFAVGGGTPKDNFFSWRTKPKLPHFPVNSLLNGYRIPAHVDKVTLSFSPPYLWIFHFITLLNYVLLLSVLCLFHRKNLSKIKKKLSKIFYSIFIFPLHNPSERKQEPLCSKKIDNF